jgi:positive regulator of sigma E activity
MQTGATVIEIADGRARVSCAHAPACGACRGGCALRWIGGGRPTLEVPLAPGVERSLQPGQAVILAVSDAELLRAAGRAYLLPLVAVLAGPLVVRILGGGEPAALAAAAGGLALGWFAARRWFRRVPPQLSVRLEPLADA